MELISVPPKPGQSKADQERIYNERIRDDFAFFVQEILLLENQPFHDEIDHDISQDYHFDDPLQKAFCVITMPRDHGKSKHLSIAYPLWRIAKDHNVRILSISGTAGIAESFLSEIVSNIERNDRYRAWAMAIDPDGVGVIPRRKPGRKSTEDWSGNSITIERREVGLKDPTIAATGLFGQILSRRADIIICDDVVDQSNSMTELQRNKVASWLDTTVIPVLIPGGTFIYLGNTWHPDDVVSRFMKDPRFQVQKRKGAIIEEATRQDLWHEWGAIKLNIMLDAKTRRVRADEFYAAHRADMDLGWKTLWKERYPYSELFFLRLLNPYVFARMYQCDPSNRPDQKIRDEWINAALERGRGLRFADLPQTRTILAVSAGGMDLAISQKESADDTSLAYMDVAKAGYDGIKDGDFIIRQIHRGNKTPNEQRVMAREAWTNHGLQSIRVESNSYQAALSIDLKDQGIPITSYHTGKEKFDPAVGINAFAVQMENGKVVIPSDPTDARTLELATQLANEMRAYTGDNTEHTGDGLMSVWFAYSECVFLLGDRIWFGNAPDTVKDTPPAAMAGAPDELRAPLDQQADRAAIDEQEWERSNFQAIHRRMLQGRR